jgi:hypothetical protein
MYEAAVLFTVTFVMFAAVDYVRRAWIRETNPVPATWILLLTMMSLSLWMYRSSEHRSWTANIGVVAGWVNCLVILVGVVAANRRHGTLSVSFSTVQRRCLIAAGCVVLFWSVTRGPLLAYTLVQCIALIAYLATVQRLWRAERTTEPWQFWASMLLTSCTALYPALVKHDPFAMIYLGRSIPSTSFMLYVIFRINRRSAPLAGVLSEKGVA